MALTTHGPVNPLSSNESFTLDYAFEGRHPRLYIPWTLQHLLRCMSLKVALSVVCCETTIRPELAAKQKWLARSQNVANDPACVKTHRLL